LSWSNSIGEENFFSTLRAKRDSDAFFRKDRKNLIRTDTQGEGRTIFARRDVRVGGGSRIETDCIRLKSATNLAQARGKARRSMRGSRPYRSVKKANVARGRGGKGGKCMPSRLDGGSLLRRAL